MTVPYRTCTRIGGLAGFLFLAAALSASPAQAQFYLGAEGGWTGLEGTKDKIGGITIDRSFDDGFNAGARFGYKWNEWRFEGEYSHRENTSNTTRFGARLNGDFVTDSFMANAIYDFNVGWLVTPHIGIGIGGADATGSLKSANFGTLSKTSDFVFAYQAIAGIRYYINPQVALDLDYRYRGMDSVSYTTRPFTLNGTVFPSKTYNGNGNTNNFVASLTYLFGAPPPPMAAPMPPPPLPPQARQVFLVFFDWDRETVTSEGRAVIQQAATAFRSGAPVQIQVTGYTDRSGSPGYNQRLSERRANNVAKALAGMGVPQTQMAVSGHGENDNRVPTADGVREPQNRRVEITSS
jgi:outer membrane protein OmpA-like peptidoglycan-associated protein